MEIFWAYGKRFSNFCFAMLLGNVGLLLVLMLAMLPVSFVTGSWNRSITISGPPSLDGPSVPWDVHVLHVASHFFPWVELWTLCLGVLPYAVLLTVGVVRHSFARVRRGLRGS